MKLKSKKSKQMLFAILKTKKLQANCNLRKIHKQFGQHNTGEQHEGKEQSDFAEPYAIGFSKSNFCFVSCETLLLGKPPESGSARLGHIPSLPWESQLPLKPCISLQPFNF